MQIETSRFGTLEVDDNRLINFPWGIPGFEDLKSYVLMEHREGPFQWLQSTEDPTVAFVVCPPEVLGIEFRIPEEKLEPIALKKKEDLLVLNLVSFDRVENIIRFHIRSPLLFNAESRTAYQWFMDSEEVEKYAVVPTDLPLKTDCEEAK